MTSRTVGTGASAVGQAANAKLDKAKEAKEKPPAVWAIRQNTFGVFTLEYLPNRGVYNYRGHDITVSQSTTGNYKTQKEAEEALDRLINSDHYISYYDENGAQTDPPKPDVT